LARWAASGTIVLISLLFSAAPAQASLGYEPAASNPTIPLHGEVAHGVAIDQSSHHIYVAELTASSSAKAPGQVEQLEGNGTPTAASPFTAASDASFAGVAVNPLSGGVYASQFVITTPFGNFGANKIHLFSSAGTLGLQFGVSNTAGTPPQIAADSSGDVYYPSDADNSVQVFNASGALQETITCGACPGGSFDKPVSVAIDSADNLYVVDIGHDLVLKFTHPGGSYILHSVLQSGRTAGAVGVDPSDNTVFVGSLSEDQGYHVIAYDSSGVQFDDFGGDLFDPPPYGLISAGQIAVNATTHKVYVADPGSEVLRVFEKVTINPPTAATDPATSVGQIVARLNATVNPRFHGLIECYFEYTDQAEFEANGYATASELPCSSMPGGSSPTPVLAQLSTLEPSTTYHFRLVAANNAGSVTGNDRTFTTLPVQAPTVTTEAAQGISQTVATLVGKVNPHGGTTSACHFTYGPGLSYAFSVACDEVVEPVTSDVAQSVKVTGLVAATTYHYRLVVTTNAGSVDGNDGEFTTLPPAPSVTTGAALGVGSSAATIAGTIDPNGSLSSCRFEYGSSTAYGTIVPCATDPGEGSDPVAEQLVLSGLSPRTTYHYRLVGSNAGGTTKGLDATFTTQALPPATLPPPEQSQPALPVITPPQALKCKKGFRKKRVRGKLKCVKKKRPKRHRR
jgi:hypothetical protein